MNLNGVFFMSETKTRNCSIDIFRYIAAVMVVAVHTNPVSDINGDLGYICTQIIPRIGVPFFFAVAGFFYVQKLEKGQAVFFSYVKKLLIVYFIWSCFYYVIDFVQYRPEEISGYIKNCVYRFLITGSYEHFWFFPALIFSVCVTTLLFKIGCRKVMIPLSILLYIIGCLGCSYYEIGISLPVLEELINHPQFLVIRRVLMMGLPFFTCGCLVYWMKDRILGTMTNKRLLFIWAGSVLIWLAEIGLVRKMNWQVNIYITFGLYLLLIATLLVLLKNPLPQYEHLANVSKMLANFTYYSHPAFIIAFTYFYNRFLQMGLPETPKFVLTTGITFIGGLILYKWNNKWINYIVNY